MVTDFAQTIERKFNLDGFSDEVYDSRPNWILRFLHYFGDRTPGEEIASAHPDKCGFSLHLHESEPGLQYLAIPPNEPVWKDMPVSATQTAIIPSMQLQYRSKGKLLALYHRVVANDFTARTGRYSMVLFTTLNKTPLYNKSALGRLQEFAPGFNYRMNFKDFAPLFEK
jgi:isopenicillin N synthase-like dioxygenase